MYRYDEFDATVVRERVAEFRGQVARRVSGELTEDQFKPLRLMNGVYLQLHAYMLRVAIPYGTLNSAQLRKLAHIADVYDKGYGHFTTRQNIQYNWPKLADLPDVLDELSEVEMHAIQTSGNCIRNVTSDQWAGAARDEIEDPRIYAELIRQWSTFHPEFSFLPRKFKIAITGAENDRAAVQVHDIGLRMRRNEAGDVGFQVIVGGGLGRSPFVGPVVRDFLPKGQLLAYLEAIMRVYNFYGRRDNRYKARIKILVHELGLETFIEKVEAEFAAMDKAASALEDEEVARITAYFAPPPFDDLPDDDPDLATARAADPAFDAWVRQNVVAHRQPGYGIVNISLKPIGGIPGDATSDQMRVVADLAERYSADEARVTHEQNLVLPHVRKRDLHAVWQGLKAADLATANHGLVSDIIACPGLDYCALATARSIPIAQKISDRFADLERQADIGDLKIKISGCINACGHHHIGHIGILGVDKRGQELYQLTLGGSAENEASIGKIIGPGFSSDEIVDAVETVVDTYLGLRQADEPFLDAYRRVGPEPFKEALYGSA